MLLLFLLFCSIFWLSKSGDEKAGIYGWWWWWCEQQRLLLGRASAPPPPFFFPPPGFGRTALLYLQPLVIRFRFIKSPNPTIPRRLLRAKLSSSVGLVTSVRQGWRQEVDGSTSGTRLSWSGHAPQPSDLLLYPHSLSSLMARSAVEI